MPVPLMPPPTTKPVVAAVEMTFEPTVVVPEKVANVAVLMPWLVRNA